jgi:hypothetical protein
MAISSFSLKFITTALLAFGLTACQTGRALDNHSGGNDSGVTAPGASGVAPPHDPFSGDDAVALELRVIIDGAEVNVPVTVEVSGKTTTVDASKGITLDEDLIGEAVFIAGDPDVTADDGRPVVVTDENLNVAPSPGLQWFTVRDGSFTFIEGNVVTIALIPFINAPRGGECVVTINDKSQPYDIAPFTVDPSGNFKLDGLYDGDTTSNQWSADDIGLDLMFGGKFTDVDIEYFDLGANSLSLEYTLGISKYNTRCTW